MPGQVMLFSSALFLFMLLLMCCGSGGIVCAEEEVKAVSQSNSVELFKKGKTKVDRSATDVSSFRAHSLVDVNELMVALAAARSNCDGSNRNIEIWSKSLRYEKNKLPSEIIKTNGGDQWRVQSATKKASESYCTELFDPSAVVKDKKIYILVSNYTTRKASERDGSDALWDLELVVGTVATSTDGSPNTITWDPSKSLKDTLKDKLPDGSSRDELPVVGRGIVMGGSTILFPLALRNINLGGDGNDGCTVIYSEDDGKNWNFPSEKIIDKDCRHAALLEWEGKLVMIAASSHSSRTRKVYVSADKGKTWAEDGESGSSLLVDFLIRAAPGDENGMTTATINGKNVALISQPAISSGSGARNPVHLFITDNKRITSVGPISPGENIGSFCRLLYTKENGGLFALCDKGPRDSPESVVLLSLAEQLERIKFVLKSWESTDGQVSSPCTSASNEAPCTTPPMPTSGLVRFLSNTGDGIHWADEYLGVSATVTEGTKVENGFKLSGPGASIVWPIGNEYQNLLYRFPDRGLTLVATVTIHENPKSDTPLMIIGLTSKLVGLWYDKENHWKGLSGEERELTTITWVKDKPYQVVITVMNGAGSVYIDGKRLGSLDPNFEPNEDGKARPRSPSGPPPGPNGDYPQLKEEVLGIWFGKYPFMYYGYKSNAASHFTLTNVFLYNRVLSEAELLPPPPQPQQDQSQSTAKGKKEVTITGEWNVEKRSNEPPAENDSSVHVSLSGVFLLFALLGYLCSAPL